MLRGSICLLPRSQSGAGFPPESRPILRCIQLDTTADHGYITSNHCRHRRLAAGVSPRQSPGSPRLPSSSPILAPQVTECSRNEVEFPGRCRHPTEKPTIRYEAKLMTAHPVISPQTGRSGHVHCPNVETWVLGQTHCWPKSPSENSTP